MFIFEKLKFLVAGRSWESAASACLGTYSCKMAGRGPRHHPKESPQLLRDCRHGKEARHAMSPELAGLTHPPSNRMDHEIPPPVVGSLGPNAMEQTLAAQHAEIQRLSGENQCLAVTHIALRQELAAAQQEIMRLQQSRGTHDTEKEQRLNITQVALRQELADSKQEVSKLQEILAAVCAEKDQQLRVMLDKSAHMEAELKAVDLLRADFEKLRSNREELAGHVEHLSSQVKKLPIQDQEIASLKREVDELCQRHQQARMDFEMQKKLNLEHLEKRQAVEKNTFLMTREIERLRAELTTAQRRQDTYMPGSSDGGAPILPIQKPVQTAGIHEKSFGTSQDTLKGSSSENKPSVGHSKYAIQAEASESHLPKLAAGISADIGAEWSKHAARNGRLFYYNVATGATQWDNPWSMVGTDPIALPQREMLRTGPGTPTPPKDPNPELATLEHPPQHKPAMQAQSTAQQSVSPSLVQIAQKPPPSNKGANLLVLGLSEGISDCDLASLFHPYGTILCAKVMGSKSGPPQFYGIVTMENTQVAEAAAAAVSGMFILGRRIKVQLQGREQLLPYQPHSPHHLMQQGTIQGGVGPMRTHHHPGGPAGQWPY